MLEKRKLLLLKLDNNTYKKLKNAALDSHRVIGTELVLRLTHSMNNYKVTPESLIPKHKVEVAADNKVVQVLLSVPFHTLLKTTSASLNMLLKDFATKLLIDSLSKYTFIASPDQAILKNK